jgi:glutamate/tyrosine decarboxylase-like PLP-dependent enzyme
MTDALRDSLGEPLPHPDAAELRDYFDQVVAWLLHHHSTLPEQRVGDSASRAEMERLLREPPPEDGQGFTQALADFTARVAPYAFRINHPRFLAFIPTAPTYAALLGDLLCAGTNFFAGVWLEASGPAEVELLVLDWFKEMLGYPAEAHGLITSGGSEANLTALLVARERLAYAERSRAVLYLSDQCHASVERAAKVIGLHPEQVRRVAVTTDWRLDLSALAAAVAADRRAGRLPLAVVANAGTTNTGTVDDIAALADFCAEHRLWLHVDAAYGWSAVLIPEGRAELAGIERADSITLDPHKWFGQTFEAGCVLVRDGRRLRDTFAQRPDYTQDVHPGEDEVNFCDHGLALTRRFRALKIWLSLKTLGLSWFRGLIERGCRLADYAQRCLEAAGFEILCPRQLSIVCFRYAPAGRHWADEKLNRLNLALVERLRLTGQAFVSSTRLGSRVALRFCFVNWRTTAADVERTVRLLAEVGSDWEESR